MANNTEELLKQAEHSAKSDPKQAEQVYKSILGAPAQISLVLWTAHRNGFREDARQRPDHRRDK
jgi:hypothetical protein